MDGSRRSLSPRTTWRPREPQEARSPVTRLGPVFVPLPTPPPPLSAYSYSSCFALLLPSSFYILRRLPARPETTARLRSRGSVGTGNTQAAGEADGYGSEERRGGRKQARVVVSSVGVTKTSGEMSIREGTGLERAGKPWGRGWRSHAQRRAGLLSSLGSTAGRANVFLLLNPRAANWQCALRQCLHLHLELVRLGSALTLRTAGQDPRIDVALGMGMHQARAPALVARKKPRAQTGSVAPSSSLSAPLSRPLPSLPCTAEPHHTAPRPPAPPPARFSPPAPPRTALLLSAAKDLDLRSFSEF
ncbi:hypothetical protein C8R45DRAFT_1111712 [Mycena sanguinolenta]|nr:hypothetical protein C8R45DRAFT_1111712 [Mycena sanguinolenta]